MKKLIEVKKFIKHFVKEGINFDTLSEYTLSGFIAAALAIFINEILEKNVSSLQALFLTFILFSIVIFPMYVLFRLVDYIPKYIKRKR